MKVALCFIISYSHILNKEQFWIDWIKPNQDIINIYFHFSIFINHKSQCVHSPLHRYTYCNTDLIRSLYRGATLGRLR